jgi:hypothetical protein
MGQRKQIVWPKTVGFRFDVGVAFVFGFDQLDGATTASHMKEPRLQ